MSRYVWISVLFALLSACPDNAEQPVIISTLSDTGSDVITPSIDIGFTDGAVGGGFDDSCYFEEAWVNDTCQDDLVEVNLPRGDRCAAPCSHQVDCPRGCTCFSFACITNSDLR